MKIRLFRKTDAQDLAKLFYDTVHEVNRRDYTKEQVKVWADVAMDKNRWEKVLSGKITYVVEVDCEIVGFAQLEKNGHINCFYCHKDFQRKGIGTLLIEKIQDKAKALDLQRLFTEASITARPFFKSKGFKVLKKQQVDLKGILFTNYRMEKIL